MRLTRLFATSAVLAASIVGFGAAPSASAQPLCEQVFVAGDPTIILPTDEDECFYSINAGLCDYEHEAVYPFVSVATFVCLPEPVAAP